MSMCREIRWALPNVSILRGALLLAVAGLIAPRVEAASLAALDATQIGRAHV